MVKELTCSEDGHFYHSFPYTFARDKHGNAFRGEGYQKAAKFTTLYCSRCGQTREIQIAPYLEIKVPRASEPKPLAAAKA